MKERLLNEKEVAEMLGLSRSTLQKRRHYGKKPCFKKLGSSVRYKLSDINEFIEENSVWAIND